MMTTTQTISCAQSRIALALVGLLLALAGCSSSEEPGTVSVGPLEELPAVGGFEPFDTPPTLTEYTPPRTPDGASATGTVMLVVTVGTAGAVEEVEVMEGVDPLLDQTAVEAAREFRFRPATQDGKPVRCRVVVPIRFEPHPDDQP